MMTIRFEDVVFMPRVGPSAVLHWLTRWCNDIKEQSKEVDHIGFHELNLERAELSYYCVGSKIRRSWKDCLDFVNIRECLRSLQM